MSHQQPSTHLPLPDRVGAGCVGGGGPLTGGHHHHLHTGTPHARQQGNPRTRTQDHESARRATHEPASQPETSTSAAHWDNRGEEHGMEDPYEELATTAWLDLSDVDEIDDESVATEADGAIMRQAMGLPAEEFDTEERNDDEA